MNPDEIDASVMTKAEVDAYIAKRKGEEETVIAPAIPPLDPIAAMQRIAQNFTPVSQEEIDRWDWEHVVVPDLRKLGWDRRHIRRIAPDWNCPKQERMFAMMGEKLKRNGAIVALVGKRGIGKTTLAAEHSRTRYEAHRAYFSVPPSERATPHPPPRPGRYEKLGRIAGLFKPLYADFGSLNTEELSRQLDAWCDCELVVIDELHESEDLKTSYRFLVDFVDRRYANHRDTVLISNHSPDEFRNEINSSIISRLSQHGAILHCEWESHRK
jgi:hypothetical protein